MRAKRLICTSFTLYAKKLKKLECCHLFKVRLCKWTIIGKKITEFANSLYEMDGDWSSSTHHVLLSSSWANVGNVPMCFGGSQALIVWNLLHHHIKKNFLLHTLLIFLRKVFIHRFSKEFLRRFPYKLWYLRIKHSDFGFKEKLE